MKKLYVLNFSNKNSLRIISLHTYLNDTQYVYCYILFRRFNYFISKQMMTDRAA